MKSWKSKLTLDGSTGYEIVVSGCLDADWSAWEGAGRITARVECSCARTIIRGTFDQAALHGLLQHLYSLGFPLISASCIEQQDPE